MNFTPLLNNASDYRFRCVTQQASLKSRGSVVSGDPGAAKPVTQKVTQKTDAHRSAVGQSQWAVFDWSFGAWVGRGHINEDQEGTGGPAPSPWAGAGCGRSPVGSVRRGAARRVMGRRGGGCGCGVALGLGSATPAPVCVGAVVPRCPAALLASTPRPGLEAEGIRRAPREGPAPPGARCDTCRHAPRTHSPAVQKHARTGPHRQAGRGALGSEQRGEGGMSDAVPGGQ
ncbi:hypothetical protein E2C01_019251 [Portunus trituberculatus]|uniref:Uncharacterized protein n=1 Tax=Portunus trituberculatus TaxID=210409 RepID=A0A5B7DYC6_PORTR|nr:hypothetical protein [Portunus trituberculatus]